MTKQEFKDILAADLARFNGKTPGFKDLILRNEAFYIWKYIYHMRKIEYHGSLGGLHKLANLWHWYGLKHLQFKLHLAIYPNTIGPGFRMFHVGDYGHIGPNVKIGKNCTIVSGVVFGNKTKDEDCRPVTVGDNVYFGIGVKVISPVHIGNNVTIGANAVVTKDIPDNAIVGGVPAKVIKIKKDRQRFSRHIFAL